MDPVVQSIAVVFTVLAVSLGFEIKRLLTRK
ncbi:hypothetical protein LMG27174_05758 [Paraburkholderia rhynchosiae]|uniref:Uncharacterized protein n=1 Tax=Paraburkholderia rhynchosiae TaxID=487049 RepID=A0A6J5CBT4_9BURK|nr:hypothetical protein LMG27174_05758 [Paraburkholderia rhynchosiae]